MDAYPVVYRDASRLFLMVIRLLHRTINRASQPARLLPGRLSFQPFKGNSGSWLVHGSR